MKLKSISSKSLIILGGIGAFLVMMTLWSRAPLLLSRISDASDTLEVIAENRVGLPIRLSIPALAIDTPLEYVGLTDDGSLATPSAPDDAGWFEFGARPGDVGSAVIDGHFGWKDNIPAIFDNLSSLEVGDKVFVEDDEGVIVTFIVRELRTYGPTDDAYDVFNSDDGKSHLNLITCQGVWNKAKKSYSERLVVFTEKIYE